MKVSPEERQQLLRSARANLSRFTPERPLMVSPAVYRAMLAEPGLSDIMDRVARVTPLPVDGE